MSYTTSFCISAYIKYYRTTATKTQRDLSPSPSTLSGTRPEKERGTVYFGSSKLLENGDESLLSSAHFAEQFYSETYFAIHSMIKHSTLNNLNAYLPHPHSARR